MGHELRGLIITVLILIWQFGPDVADKILSYAGELDELPTPYKFDVTDYKNLVHQGMKNSIDNDGILFYQR